jgi:O-antigen/teichoic acid export membrane protein
MLAHLFGIIDRTMIIHTSGLDPTTALQQVGHYHSSRLVPMLLVSFAGLLSGLVMPHMSHDWEAGRRDLVSDRLNFTLKLTGLGMLAFGVGVLLFAPLLFHVILQGKYADGLAVLPWTLTGCIWYGIYEIAHNYLWCAEKTKLATVPLALGLAANILLNLLLLPVWGLLGAVVATGISTLLCLVLTLLLNRHSGMRIASGTWLAILAPASIILGTAASMVTLLLIVSSALGTNILFSNKERQEIKKVILNTLSRLPLATSWRWSTSEGA